MLTSASFKLQKLNRSMEFKSNPSKTESTLFTPRMSANISIAKSVKYNNIQFITGQELCKLRRQPEQPSDNPEFSTAKNNMTNIKKRYDQTNHQKIYLSNKIQRLNELKLELTSQVAQFQSNKSSGQIQVTHLDNQLQSIKLKLLDKDFQKMSMTQMRDVIVHDKIVYDKKKYDLEKQLQRIIFKSKSIKQANLKQFEQDDRTLKVYEKLMSKLDSQSKQRQEHINSIQSRVIEKEGVQNSSLLRKSQMMSIAETTMCERDPEQKEWINIYLTHKLLKDLLESKIERQMEKFSQVENAFKNIKIATGVNDAQSLVRKFLSKQEVYGDLLSKITQNEREIQVLRMDKERYLKEIKKTEEELQQLQAIKAYDEDLREWLKQAEYYEERKKRSEFQDMKLKQYLFKQLKRLNSEQSDNNKKDRPDMKQNQNIKLVTKEAIKQKLIHHLKHLSDLVDQSQKLQISTNNSSQNESSKLMSDQAMSKIFRVKPHVKLDAESINDKNLSSGYVHPYEQEEITTANDQIQAVDEQRINLLKSNQKFMKQLKRKIEEQKQLMVQTLVKNAKEKAPAIPVKKLEPPQQ